MRANFVTWAALLLLTGLIVPVGRAQAPAYDLLLKGGHVIDGRNGISAIRDVAITGDRVAAVAASIRVPGQESRGRDRCASHRASSIFTCTSIPGEAGHGCRWRPRPGTRWLHTAQLRDDVADAGSSGWRTFEDFKKRVIDRSKTRVTAFLNIVGVGCAKVARAERSGHGSAATAEMALKYKGVIVGIKSAHYSGPGWGRARRPKPARPPDFR